MSSDKTKPKYSFSNSSEFCAFSDVYCENCIHQDPDPDGKRQCLVIANILAYDFEHENYPDEIINMDGRPLCTKFAKWDWQHDGDPDDPFNPNRPIINPDQLSLFK